jgi:hypothetical protein
MPRSLRRKVTHKREEDILITSQRAYIERITAAISNDLTGTDRRKPASPTLVEPKQSLPKHDNRGG